MTYFTNFIYYLFIFYIFCLKSSKNAFMTYICCLVYGSLLLVGSTFYISQSITLSWSPWISFMQCMMMSNIHQHQELVEYQEKNRKFRAIPTIFHEYGRFENPYFYDCRSCRLVTSQKISALQLFLQTFFYFINLLCRSK